MSKIAVASSVIGSLPMQVFADQVITIAKKRMAFFESVARWGQRRWWVLYVAGFIMILYGLVKRIEIPRGSE